MSSWSPASREDVEAEIRLAADDAGPEIWRRYAPHLIDPVPVAIERFGLEETAFVVARTPLRCVFFDDVEEIFGTATETEGKLADIGMYGDIRVAIREAEAGR